MRVQPRRHGVPQGVFLELENQADEPAPLLVEQQVGHVETVVILDEPQAGRGPAGRDFDDLFDQFTGRGRIGFLAGGRDQLRAALENDRKVDQVALLQEPRVRIRPQPLAPLQLDRLPLPIEDFAHFGNRQSTVVAERLLDRIPG